MASSRGASVGWWRWVVAACVFVVACGPPPPPGIPGSATPPAATAPPPAVVPNHSVVEFQEALQRSRDRLTAQEAFRLNLVSSLGFVDGPVCFPGPSPSASEIDVDRSLWIHDRATLDATFALPTPGLPTNFSLRSTLGRLAAEAVAAGALGTTDVSLFAALWDTQNTADSAVVPTGSHCTDNGGRVNDFPMSCRPAEGGQAAVAATEIDKYWPIGLVNRMDLAGQGWRNCGEFRIVYGRNDVPLAGNTTRAFIIFEAVLPNPRPGCRSACEPVAERWASLSNPALTASARAQLLGELYYQGFGDFERVVQIDHYTAQGVGSVYGSSGSGQIRTNQFMQNPWVTKEFRLALDCTAGSCALSFVPTMVKVNPFGHLWRELSSIPAGVVHDRALDFQADLLANVAGLSLSCPAGGGDINRISYPVDVLNDAADSTIVSFFEGGSTNDFLHEIGLLNIAFKDQITAAACGLTFRQIVGRAQALSCAGCHASGVQFTVLNNIGTVTLPNGTTTTRWPRSVDFVHSRETPATPGGSHELSAALTDVFLPERKRFMVSDVLSQDVCACEQRFIHLPPPLRVKMVPIQDQVSKVFGPRIVQETEMLKKLTVKPPSVARTREMAKARAAIDGLNREREQALIKAAKAQNIVLPPLKRAVVPEVLQLGAAGIAAGDPKRLGALRQAAVMEVLRREPSRRTVTGSFRVH